MPLWLGWNWRDGNFGGSGLQPQAAGNAKALAVLTQISPVAWRHILLNGHYTFQSDGKVIDLDALVAGVELA
ncbi:hypothetical protein [Escherichia coli]|uniref:hypothetical protein n=1 Tax=Escherichia coli TaxID=562 RepID=UPI00224AD480|nr:hypothetical protein [Escherichia coli]UZR92218.1 hypothetical protein ORI33_23775 [Escherichia coli]